MAGGGASESLGEVNRYKGRLPLLRKCCIAMVVLATGIVASDQFQAVSAAKRATVTNWAGFVDKAKNPDLHGAVGAWTVPRVVCAAGETSRLAVWVGIGGDYRTTNGVETLYQDGTDSDCLNGLPRYYAWQQQFGEPNLAQKVSRRVKRYPAQLVLGCDPQSETICTPLSVQPGDKISASIVDRGLETHWSISDDRHGKGLWTHSSFWRTDYQHKHSGECIVEDPEVLDGDQLFTLPEFGRITFSKCETIDPAGRIRSIDSASLPAGWTFAKESLIDYGSAVATPSTNPLAVTRTDLAYPNLDGGGPVPTGYLAMANYLISLAEARNTQAIASLADPLDPSDPAIAQEVHLLSEPRALDQLVQVLTKTHSNGGDSLVWPYFSYGSPLKFDTKDLTAMGVSSPDQYSGLQVVIYNVTDTDIRVGIRRLETTAVTTPTTPLESAAPCTTAAITAGVDAAATEQSMGPVEDLEGLGCSGVFAYAFADVGTAPNVNEVTILLMSATSGAWEPADRATYCENGSVPSDLAERMQ
jgi:hypothetical protein